MKAVITVVGKDRTGIIAKVSGYLADRSINILDISQTIMQDLFTMIMLVDTQESGIQAKERSFPLPSTFSMKVCLPPCTGCKEETNA